MCLVVMLACISDLQTSKPHFNEGWLMFCCLSHLQIRLFSSDNIVLKCKGMKC
jgi:hypothetical protein